MLLLDLSHLKIPVTENSLKWKFELNVLIRSNFDRVGSMAERVKVPLFMATVWSQMHTLGQLPPSSHTLLHSWIRHFMMIIYA